MSSSSYTEPICSAWIDGADVAACADDDLGIGSDVSQLDAVAYDASWLLYEATGRRYPGVCERTVRPCRDRCGCWGAASGPIYDPTWSYDSVGGWTWRLAPSGRSCGCGTEAEILLAGYPVLAVTAVKIDGELVDPDTYVLVDGRRLLRRDDPGPPVVRRRWPACQNITLPDTEPGTFSIAYQWGGLPPAAGAAAAAQLARELWKICGDGATGDCALPDGVTRIVRQGVTYETVRPLAVAISSGSTGLKSVDAFVGAANAAGPRRPPAIWSPDRRPFPRRVDA